MEQRVDSDARRLAAANHSGTHLLHAALQAVLGDHVRQKGSYVGPDRLRFDFAHNKPVTLAQLNDIEQRVNEQVLGNSETGTQIMALEDALATGAMAMFGEKYDDQVRVLTMGRAPDALGDTPYSVELCGGTHVARAGDIGLFKIVSESSVGAGVRSRPGVADSFGTRPGTFSGCPLRSCVCTTMPRAWYCGSAAMSATL